MPADTEAGTYSAVLQYLKAVATAGTDAAEPVMAALRATTVRDAFTAKGICGRMGGSSSTVIWCVPRSRTNLRAAGTISP